MKRTFKIHTCIECPPEKEGESIEELMRKASNSKEPIENVAPMIYTDRKDGVLPQYDYRTDRFEIAREATDRVHATRAAAAKKAMEADAKKAAEEGKPAGEA